MPNPDSGNCNFWKIVLSSLVLSFVVLGAAAAPAAVASALLLLSPFALAFAFAFLFLCLRICLCLRGYVRFALL